MKYHDLQGKVRTGLVTSRAGFKRKSHPELHLVDVWNPQLASADGLGVPAWIAEHISVTFLFFPSSPHSSFSLSCQLFFLVHNLHPSTCFCDQTGILDVFFSCFDSASVYFMGGFADRSSWFIEFYDGAPVSFFSFKWNVNSISNSNRERLMSIVWTIDVVWNIKLSPDVSGEADPCSAQSGGHLASSVVSSRSKGCSVEYPHSYKHRRARHSGFGSRRPLWLRLDANIEVRIDCVLFFRRLPLPS